MSFRSRPAGGRLFPHHLDHAIARMPHDQRFEVTWPAPLGPWTRGDVIERHVDLVGAHLPTLLALRAVRPTSAPAKKHPATLANLAARSVLSEWRPNAIIGAVQDAGGEVAPGQAARLTAPVAGAPNPKNPTTVVVPKG